jgi:hypothetical protein
METNNISKTAELIYAHIIDLWENNKIIDHVSTDADYRLTLPDARLFVLEPVFSAWVTIKKLASIVGCSQDTAKRYIDELLNNGYIKRYACFTHEMCDYYTRDYENYGFYKGTYYVPIFDENERLVIAKENQLLVNQKLLQTDQKELRRKFFLSGEARY